jgi:Fe2+ or Zn2+ uptake regulation protein
MDVLDPVLLSERLRAAGLRATRPRLAVYRALADLGGHRAADDVYERVVASGARLSRTSVYNALDALEAARVVLLADAGPGRRLFEVGTTWHHHAVCRHCGQISDIACAVGEKPCLEPDDPDWGDIDEAQIIFRGVCAACRSKDVGEPR